MKIYLTGKCNNNCLFCQQNRTDELGGSRIKSQIDSLDIYKDNRIVFTGTDPAVRQDIFDLLVYARETKVGIRQLNTNGRMFSDLLFAKKIISCGANYFKLSVHGHNPRLHDRITQSRGSFRQTVQGIKNLIQLGQKDNIVLSVVVTSLNYKYLHRILKAAKQLNIKKVQLNVVKTEDRNLLAPLSKLAEQIVSMRNRFLFDLFIKIKSFPYCLIQAPESLFIRDKDGRTYVFPEECRGCKYGMICRGVLKAYVESENIPAINAVPDLPSEVMIEAESRCNFKCAFCFNRASFASRGFGVQQMETAYIKAVIDNIKQANVSTVRFTGGEPMLRDDFLELIKYAKYKGLQVRLNTNGSLIESYRMAEEMVQYLDYVLFAMHAHTPEQDERITGFKGSFEKKIRAMKWLRRAGIKILRVNTIASLENIKNLEKFYALFKQLKVDRWAVNRLIPLSKRDEAWGQRELDLLIRKLTKIKKYNMRMGIPMWIHIVNAVPFCAGDPLEISAISSGGRAVDGHERFAVDPRKFAKPIYYIDENIGDPLDILGCWHHPFMKSIRGYEMLPGECKQCFILDRCKGGNRFCAWIAGGSYASADPLMDYANVKKYIW